MFYIHCSGRTPKNNNNLLLNTIIILLYPSFTKLVKTHLHKIIQYRNTQIKIL